MNHASESLSVSASAQDLIMQKLDLRIFEKQIIPQKLTAFVFQDIAITKLNLNIQQMIPSSVNSSNQTLQKDRSFHEPNKLGRDNYNPKQIRVQNYASFEKKIVTKKPRMLKFSSKKQSISYNQTFRNQEIIQSNQLKIFRHQSNDLQRSIELCSPKFRKKANKIKKQPIELNTKANIIDRVSEEFEQRLRANKQKQQQHTIRNIQLDNLKNKLFERLRQKVKNLQQKDEMINFDYDGSIINLNDEKQQTFSEKQGKRHFETRDPDVSKVYTKSLHKNIHNSNRSVQKRIQRVKKTELGQSQIGSMPFQTISFFSAQNYELIQNEQSARINANNRSLNRSKVCSPFSSQSLRSSELPLDSAIKNTHPISKTMQSISLSSQNSQKFQRKHQVKIFRSTCHNNKNQRKQIQARQLHKQKSKQFTNNFQRQSSTIPYLEIAQGVRYQQQIASGSNNIIKQPKNVRFATIQKTHRYSQKSIFKKQAHPIKNLTFRSFLPLTQRQSSEYNKNQQMSKTISLFSQTGKSFHFFLDKKFANKKTQKESPQILDTKDQFAFLDTHNPILIKDIQTQRIKSRPFTTPTAVKLNKTKQGKKKMHLEQKKAGNDRMMEMKQKILLKQKYRILQCQPGQHQ